MGKLVTGAGVVLLLLAPSALVRAGDREAALAVIDRGIQAQGGEQALAKSQLVMRRGTGTMNVFEKEVPFTDDALFHLPDQFRLMVNLGAADQKTQVIVVMNGNKGWRSTGGATTEMGKEALEEFRQACYLFWVGTLVPLKKDSAFELSMLPEIKVQDQPAVGVKVSRKGRGDVNLYFDKSSGLLVKMGHKTTEAGIKVDKDYVLGDYKVFDGVKLPARQTELTNGKKFNELNITSYRFPEKVDEGAFGKP